MTIASSWKTMEFPNHPPLLTMMNARSKRFQRRPFVREKRNNLLVWCLAYIIQLFHSGILFVKYCRSVVFPVSPLSRDFLLITIYHCWHKLLTWVWPVRDLYFVTVHVIRINFPIVQVNLQNEDGVENTLGATNYSFSSFLHEELLYFASSQSLKPLVSTPWRTNFHWAQFGSSMAFLARWAKRLGGGKCEQI